MGAITRVLAQFGETWKTQGLPGKAALAISTLLVLCCMCSIPVAILTPDEEDAAPESRAQEISLADEESKPTKTIRLTDTPQPTDAPSPTSAPKPTETAQATETLLPEPTDTAPSPTETQQATETLLPEPTDTELPPTETELPPTETPQATETLLPEPTDTVLPPTEAPSNEEIARVVSIVDGDTFDINLNGNIDRVRMIGINADEYDQQCGQESAIALGSLILNQDVRLVKDVSERDVFDRLLRYVYRGEVFVNAEMVRQGYAFALEYPPDVAQASYLASQESGAAVPACRNVVPPTQPPAEPPPAPVATEPPAGNAEPPATTEPPPPPPPPPAPPDGAPEWCTCTGRDYDCADFGTHSAAQACYNYCVSQGRGDYYNIDGRDNDGLACESLP